MKKLLYLIKIKYKKKEKEIYILIKNLKIYKSINLKIKKN
jgi:hypothetical protein